MTILEKHIKEHGYVRRYAIRVHSSGEMEAPETEEGEVEEPPLLFCKEQQVYWDTGES